MPGVVISGVGGPERAELNWRKAAPELPGESLAWRLRRCLARNCGARRPVNVSSYDQARKRNAAVRDVRA